MSVGDKVIAAMMELEPDPMDWSEDYDDRCDCWQCGGDGYLGSDCIDDMCHGGEVPCLHGDHGEIRCNVCDGEGGW